MVSKSKLGYALFKIKKILKIKQKNFVLLLIKRRYLSGTPDTWKEKVFKIAWWPKHVKAKYATTEQLVAVFSPSDQL